MDDLEDKAARIELALAYSNRGYIPKDATDRDIDDIDWIKSRYSILKRTHSFDESAKIARTEFIVKILDKGE